MAAARLVATSAERREEELSLWRSVLTHTHTYSGRADHGGARRPPGSYRRLAAWARESGVDALGMGSPWTPRNAADFAKYEGPRLAGYYAGKVRAKNLASRLDVDRMLARVNDLAGGDTWFYLDNESPKGRFGHLWWIGWNYDHPAWHDNDQVWDAWMVQQATPEQDGQPEPMPYVRRAYSQIVAEQRSAGALGFWAHPTSWWRGDRGQFITNIATELPAHLVADGGADGMVVMGYDAWRPQYFDLWTALLDRGWRLPGVAEMDMGLSGDTLDVRSAVMLTHVHLGERPWSLSALAEAFRGGRLYASTGPFLELSVDGSPMGSAVATAPQRKHTVRLVAWAKDFGEPLGCVELIGRGGQVLWRADDFAGGTATLELPGTAERSYLLARAFGAGESPGRVHWRDIRKVAIANPVYLHPQGAGFPAPATTECTLTIAEGSPLAGGRVQFETALGELLEEGPAHVGTLRRTLPVGGRITFLAEGRHVRTDYLIHANQPLQDLQRYLYRGGFTRDFPAAEPGDVPVAAWRLEEYLTAMEHVEIVR